jgi:uncharacterized RDD family membrane protein YckC
VYCPQCGASAADDARFCRSCGAALSPPESTSTAAPPADAPAVRPGYLASNVDSLGVAPPVPVRYGGFWRRFAAYVIDIILVYIISFVVGLVVGLILVFARVNSDLITVAAAVVGVAIALLYYPLQESSEAQATLGKRALDVKVTDLNGQRISFLRALGRMFAKLLSGLLFCIGYIMAAFTSKKQALHDKIAGTLVVRV